MNKVRQIIRLHTEGKNKTQISKLTGVARNTVKRYLKIIAREQLTHEQVSAMNNHQLSRLFMSDDSHLVSEKVKHLHSLLPWITKQLARRHMTNKLVWQEYQSKHPDGLGRSQFNHYLHLWLNKAKPTMHIAHKAGDKMFIDYTGQKLFIVDEQTGEQVAMEVFAAILGYSGLTYVEAVHSQTKEDLIRCCENALHYFGGVPQAIVPDNLKSAVTKSSKYEPTLNDTFEDFAQHYNTAVLPARAHRPKDKSLVEGVVKIIYRRIYTSVDKKNYFSLEELNKAVRAQLETHNHTPLTGRTQNRRELFEETERTELRALPQYPYLMKQQRTVTVLSNNHVCLRQDMHYYSVPFHHMGKKVKLMYSEAEVDIYLKYEKIASHKRNYKPHEYSTITEHLATAHRFLTDWNEEKFIALGNEIHSDVGHYLQGIFDTKPHPEQAYKSCSGILSFVHKVGKQRLINACKRGSEYKVFGYGFILKILERKLDSIEPEEQLTLSNTNHTNIRGSNYYK